MLTIDVSIPWVGAAESHATNIPLSAGSPRQEMTGLSRFGSWRWGFIDSHRPVAVPYDGYRSFKWQTQSQPRWLYGKNWSQLCHPLMGHTMSTPLHGVQQQEWKTFSRQRVMTALHGFGGSVQDNQMVVAYRNARANLDHNIIVTVTQSSVINCSRLSYTQLLSWKSEEKDLNTNKQVNGAKVIMTTVASENLFRSLPRKTQIKIDSAFDLVCKKFTTRSKSEEIPAGGFIPEPGSFIRDSGEGGSIRKEDTSGGFLRDEQGDLGCGGFLNDDEYEEKSAVYAQMPFSLISRALQHLDLPPDDEEILSVFRNAATGWTSSHDNTSTVNQSHGDKDQFVSRDDWRSVCAVLLEREADVEMADGTADSDEYWESEAETEEAEGDDDDDDDYIEDPSTSTARRRTRLKGTQISPISSSDNQPQNLTSQQRQTCIDTYSLFFPTTSANEVLNQRITIKDLQRVAKLLHEKLTAGDVSHFTFLSVLLSIVIDICRCWKCWKRFLHRLTNLWTLKTFVVWWLKRNLFRDRIGIRLRPLPYLLKRQVPVRQHTQDANFLVLFSGAPVYNFLRSVQFCGSIVI